MAKLTEMHFPLFIAVLPASTWQNIVCGRDGGRIWAAQPEYLYSNKNYRKLFIVSLFLYYWKLCIYMWDSVSLNEQLGVFEDQFKKLLKKKLTM